MDDFDVFNSTNEQNYEANQEDDLIGTDFNTTASASTNIFDSAQQPDLSWAMDDNLTDTTTSISQSNIFDIDENFPSTSQNDLLANQSTTDEIRSYSPSANELLQNDSSRRSSDFSKETSLFSNVSPLEAFNARRQQEIAELDAVEKQKIDELRRQGKKDLERWYEERHLRMEQNRQSLKQEQDTSLTEALQKSDKQTCDWAKVIRYLEFSQGTQLTKQKRDLNRMRAVIIQAKRDKDNRTSENGV